VAWAACFYSDWSGDAEFERGPGRTLLVETARYWASRIRRENCSGRAHIYGVIGPDEYHEPVDDNAFTNVLVRWNLRRAASAPGIDAAERREWLELADALVDGYDSESGLYEQFAGYFDLEPLLVSDFAATRPVTADTVLGRPRVRRTQVLKQADVLMLHHLLPDEVVPGSLEPNLAFYEPRTAHGSSLSPAVYASLFARVGRLSEAVELLRRSSRLDLDDTTATTAEGLHMATMGGVWQALAFGFAGARARGERLELDPRLPDEWSGLELRLRYRRSTIKVRVERSAFTVHASRPVTLSVGGASARVARAGVRFRRVGETWTESR
jgi:trehalose/maltose hydrolase-like predicted phosphorylase